MSKVFSIKHLGKTARPPLFRGSILCHCSRYFFCESSLPYTSVIRLINSISATTSSHHKCTRTFSPSYHLSTYSIGPRSSPFSPFTMTFSNSQSTAQPSSLRTSHLALDKFFIPRKHSPRLPSTLILRLLSLGTVFPSTFKLDPSTSEIEDAPGIRCHIAIYRGGRPFGRGNRHLSGRMSPNGV